ncbi:MAG: RNA polymerase sigma factor [Phycisphaerae bacterium]
MLVDMGFLMRWQQPEPDRDPALWTELSARLHALARSLTRSEADAADLTQQAFAQVLATRPERATHVGYLRQTLMRVWISRQRSMRREAARWLRIARQSALAVLPVDRVSDAEAVDRVRTQIDLLPPMQRAVLALRLIEELEYEQIATTLGISVESARSTLHAARLKVRLAAGETE